MMQGKIISKEPMLMNEVKDFLDSEEELNYRAGKTKDYLQDFSFISTKKAKELMEKLDGLKITRLKNEIVCKIADVLPQDVDELKSIMQAYTVTLPEKDYERIVKLVKEVHEFKFK